ncbi:polysaccharide biosynthesis tyrosine autokinase [Spongisporangium articulatum]|uniref:Polysaccharide biosynthesis tyrosine autokinase n=1 Tax=Spongisporangium articulatum TaxID=3362603 RepID=A0ABW8AVD5_9ACTN
MGTLVTLAQYLQALKKHWLIVLVLTMLGTAAAVGVVATATPKYEATAKLFVASRTQATSIDELSVGSDFTQQRVKSYADAVTSPTLLGPVIAELNLPYTARELAKNVTATSADGTVVLEVTVYDTDASRATAIANAIGARFPTFVAGLEAPGASSDTSLVRVTLIQPAVVPDNPITPKVPLDIAFGLLAGLGLGLTVAVARQQLDNAVRSAADVEALTGAAPLGLVPLTRRSGRQPLAQVGEHSPRAEAFRTLRTNLQFTSVDTPAKLIVVSSALPNEGKSTVSANLAVALAAGGAKVALVDGDLRKPTVGRLFDLSDGAGLTSVLAGRDALDEVLVPIGGALTEGLPGTVTALPAGPVPPNPSELLASGQMKTTLATLRETFDVVVIDAPPLMLVTDAAILASEVDGVILVGRHGKTRRDEFTQALNAVRKVGATVLGTVLNFAPKPSRSGYYGYTSKQVSEALAMPAQREAEPAEEKVETKAKA